MKPTLLALLLSFFTHTHAAAFPLIDRKTPSRMSTLSNHNNAQSPVKVSLPPLSSILLSPAESSLRNSFIESSTPHAPRFTSKTINIFDTSKMTKSNTMSSNPFPVPYSKQHTNIFNPQQTGNIGSCNANSSFNSASNSRTYSLPSIENLTSSPTLKKSLSYSNALTLPTPTNKLNQIPLTPLSLKKLPTLPLFNIHSTPNSSHLSSLPGKSNNNINANTSIISEIHDQSFIHSTPFKSTKNKDSMVLRDNDNSMILNKKKRTSSSVDESKSFAFISHSQETFLSNEPDIDNARLARRKRRRTSPTELAILKDEFKKGTTPNKQRRILIAQKVDMTEKAVQIWFQNRRQATRKTQFQNSKQYVVEINQDKSSILGNELGDDVLLDADDEVVSGDNDIESDTAVAPTTTAASKMEASKTDKSYPLKSNTGPISSPNASDSEENKENINPATKINSLPPRGIFSSVLNTKKAPKKTPLSDITNQQQAGQTFKFKSTNFGLIAHNSYTSRRQKPTMRLKLKFSNNTSNNSNSNVLNKNNNDSAIPDALSTIANQANVEKPSTTNILKHQSLVILSDATHSSN